MVLFWELSWILCLIDVGVDWKYEWFEVYGVVGWFDDDVVNGSYECCEFVWFKLCSVLIVFWYFCCVFCFIVIFIMVKYEVD